MQLFTESRDSLCIRMRIRISPYIVWWQLMLTDGQHCKSFNCYWMGLMLVVLWNVTPFDSHCTSRPELASVCGGGLKTVIFHWQSHSLLTQAGTNAQPVIWNDLQCHQLYCLFLRPSHNFTPDCIIIIICRTECYCHKLSTELSASTNADQCDNFTDCCRVDGHLVCS